MCVANYITTCGCTDGNISAPAGARTKTKGGLAVAATIFDGRVLERFGLFSICGFQTTAWVDRLQNISAGVRLAGMSGLFELGSHGSPSYDSVFLWIRPKEVNLFDLFIIDFLFHFTELRKILKDNY